MTAKYDQQHARELLDACAQHFKPAVAARKTAAMALLDELRGAVGAVPDVQAMDVNRDRVLIVLDQGASVLVTVLDNGVITLAKNEVVTQVPLDVDRSGNEPRLVGQEFEQQVAPGQRRSRRDALVVLVEHIVAALQPESGSGWHEAASRQTQGR